MTRAVWVAGALCGLGLIWLAFTIPVPAIPSFQAVRASHRPSDVQLLDRNGEVIHEARMDKTGRRLSWVSLAEISPALRAAVIASEDRRFFSHGGVDARALVAAAFQWAARGPRRGASTISMQVASLLTGSRRQGGVPRTLVQKWRQMRLAWALEGRWSKAEILETYLNRVPFRGEVQGIAAAAGILFGKASHGITEAEAAVLAALIRAPNAGQEVVLRRAWAIREAHGGSLSREEIVAAVARALDASSGTGPRVALAPHAARHLLEPLRGAKTPRPTRSTLDAALQRVAMESLVRHLLAARDRHVQDGAVLVVENATGDVLAYVGGSGELSSARHVDGVRAMRQAGSTLKPFLYGLALEQRLLTPASLLEDAPLEISLAAGLYRPRNYDEQFRGILSLRTALAGSVNVPAVRTLNLVGTEALAAHLRRLGFEGLTESGDYYGPALALGSADVSLWELVNAYRTLANGGVWSPLRMRAEAAQPSRRQPVLSPQAAFLVSHILADRESRTATFGLENPLATRFWSAAKTGTSKDMRDNWCIGFSPRYTVGVWVGNFSGEPMQDVSGVTGAAPVWLEVMSWLHRSGASRAPKPPAGLLPRMVSFPHGIEPDRVEWFLEGTEPQTARQGLAASHPRILAPVSGTTVALDPDIPRSRQRIIFESNGATPLLRWVLDGTDLGPAPDLVAWDLQPGSHSLSLVDALGQALDTSTFEVRGSLPDSSN